MKPTKGVHVRSRRRIRATVLAIGASSLMIGGVVSAGPASASASGCTWAPGGAFAQQCIHVWGGGLHIAHLANQYFASPWSGWGSNVCRRMHREKFTDLDNVVRFAEQDLASCITGAAAVSIGDYSVWYPNRDFHNKRGMCAFSNNSDTGGTWTPQACVTVHS